MIIKLTRFYLLIFFLCGFSGAVAQSQDFYDFSTLKEKQRFMQLTQSLRCLVCQNQSISDSDAALASDLRAKVLALLREGRSDSDIKAYLVERYGEFILFSPPLKYQTALLWFFPLLCFVVICRGFL